MIITDLEEALKELCAYLHLSQFVFDMFIHHRIWCWLVKHLLGTVRASWDVVAHVT